MNIEVNLHRTGNLSYVVIDNYFSSIELSEVLQELKDLKRLSVGPEFTNTATNFNGEFKKTGSGVELDTLYADRTLSPTLKATRKIFDPTIYSPMVEFDAVFNFIPLSNTDFCLVNYYAPGQEYLAHEDNCQLSAVTLLGFGEFTGGGFTFPDQGVEIEFKQSRTIIFPSCARHASMPLQGGPGACRVSIAQFINNRR